MIGDEDRRREGNTAASPQRRESNGAVLGIALNDSNRWQLLAVGLGDVEHIGCAEASHGGSTLCWLFVPFFFAAKHGSENLEKSAHFLIGPSKCDKIASDC